MKEKKLSPQVQRRIKSFFYSPGKRSIASRAESHRLQLPFLGPQVRGAAQMPSPWNWSSSHLAGPLGPSPSTAGSSDTLPSWGFLSSCSRWQLGQRTLPTQRCHKVLSCPGVEKKTRLPEQASPNGASAPSISPDMESNQLCNSSASENILGFGELKIGFLPR